MKQNFIIPRKRPFKNVYQFKITLLDTKPPVWRRIIVPESYTFYDLHVAIQNAMGWTDSHLHSFEERNSRFNYEDHSTRIESPYATEEMEDDIRLTTETSLKEFFKKENDKMLYTYDFGDNWEHEVVLEAIISKDAKKQYPICLAGRLANPPEDCGSIPGYYQCIKTFKDKKDKELLEWMGDWNPYYFDPKDVVFENPRERFLESWE